ncbi:MAG TPA: rhomboid family intramembrane serine protease [Candidatus Limnocylindrales bacterium]|nr:rhomboid family intramembrane serine protease [Candidatus Limnocylindrales bacterium]
MIPLADLNPTRSTPIANRLLLLVNIAVWIYVVTLLGRPAALRDFYERYAFDWSEFVSLIGAGRIELDTFVPLVTHMFLHGSWLHIVANMLYLWIFGDNVEERIGSGPYVLFYFLAGTAGALLQGLIAPAPMVGASAAIAGVLGAYAVMYAGAHIRTLIFLGIFITVVNLPALVVIGFWFVAQVLSGLAELRLSGQAATENVAYWAHVGGFVAGIALLRFFPGRRTSTRLR